MKVGDLIARSLCKNASTRPDAFYCTQQQQQPGAETHQQQMMRSCPQIRPKSAKIFEGFV